jgi:hypothetical protein
VRTWGTIHSIRFWTAALALTALAACGDSPRANSSDLAAALPVPIAHIRAALVLEPSRLKVGEVSTAVVTVVTPPDHRLLPVSPPEVPGVWLLDATSQDVARSQQRWVHRTRIRLRAREVGRLVWPAFDVSIEDADGAKHTVPVGERAFEVVSVLRDHPDQVTPFGLRTAPKRRGGGDFWIGAGAGAAATLALAATAFAFYRARDRVPPESEAARRDAMEKQATLWEWADSELAQAMAALDSKDGPHGPRDAANRGARLLRQYVARRFNVQTEALTTEELDATHPPLAIDSRWPELVRILGRFDAERFRQALVDDAAADRIRRSIDEVKHFVDDSMPPELRR